MNEEDLKSLSSIIKNTENELLRLKKEEKILKENLKKYNDAKKIPTKLKDIEEFIEMYNKENKYMEENQKFFLDKIENFKKQIKILKRHKDNLDEGELAHNKSMLTHFIKEESQNSNLLYENKMQILRLEEERKKIYDIIKDIKKDFEENKEKEDGVIYNFPIIYTAGKRKHITKYKKCNLKTHIKRKTKRQKK